MHSALEEPDTKRSRLEQTIAVLKHVSDHPGQSFTYVTYGTMLNSRIAHGILRELEEKGFLDRKAMPPRSVESARSRRALKAEAPDPNAKYWYVLTKKGKDLLFWWDTFTRAYEGEHVPKQTVIGD